ncbi:hypothetical protein ['Paenibacillus yunnanensis' Narsing Rao et al. 2020]|uniref:hypothetical protein n=1 Tax=Paenibacillus tengchongensis TaxID=2608684 RepID=UPI001652337A|nr:hypothetical protein [Paenibacillus tengchongensis]
MALLVGGAAFFMFNLEKNDSVSPEQSSAESLKVNVNIHEEGKRYTAAAKLMQQGDAYLARIMSDGEGEDAFTNHVLAEINYRAFLSFQMSESLRMEYGERLRGTETGDNCSIYSAISKDGVHFIAVAYPQYDSDSYEPTINIVTGNNKEYEFFKRFLEPPGMADSIYYAVDLYAEDLIGDRKEFEVELWEPSAGAADYPVEHPEQLDSNVDTILKEYSRAAPSNLVQNKKWNLFLFHSYAARPVFVLRYNGEVLELKG